ncbi:MAG: hypothetical protein NTZ61_19050 [Proteobacteria bacterium]|nr:hypothetical protein [Pseudomonadota bacterium]
MEITMGVKDTVRALLERLPDDCKLEEVIDQLCLLEAPRPDDAEMAPLSDGQRRELERRLDLLDTETEPDVPWREALDRMRR